MVTKSKTAFTLVLLLLLASVHIASAQDEVKEEWIMETRGENYDIYVNSANPNLKRWNSANQRVLNSNGEWVDYVFRDLYEAEGKYVVQSGLVAAEIYDYYAKIFTPDMSEVRIYSEMWEVQQLGKSGKWSDVGAQSGTPTYQIVEFADGVNITKSFSSWAGRLDITYTFRGHLKHTVVFRSEIAEATTFRLVQKWSGIVAAKVKTVNPEASATEHRVLSAVELDGTEFLFQKENGELSVIENQWSAKEYLSYVEADAYAGGIKCDYYFGNWTLAAGERLEIDPETATLGSPTEDGHIRCRIADMTCERWNTSDPISMMSDLNIYWYYIRGYVEWDISSIPDSVTIVSAAFKYHGVSAGACYIRAMSARPSASSSTTIFTDAGDGTIYVSSGFVQSGTNKQVDLGASAVSDLQGKLASDWFALGFQTQYEGSDMPVATSLHSSEHGSATPKPTLYVTYSEPPTYSDISHSTTVADASCQFNITADDAVGLHTEGYYRFATNNTGSWIWDDAVNFVSTPQTVSVTKTLTSTVGQTVGYRWNITDNAGVTNATEIYTLTTTDGTPPSLGEISANATVADNPVQLSVNINDNAEVSHYIFSWNNTGTWTNGTTTAWVSNPTTFTGTWNETVGNTVSVKVYANDTSNNWATSTTYNFTLTNYHCYFTYLPVSPTQGDNVDITVHVQKAGESFSNYSANITRNGALWKTNITPSNSTFTDVSLEATTKTYTVQTLYDTELESSVDFSVTPATITWTATGSTSPGSPTTPTTYAVSIRVVRGTSPVPSATVILASDSKITDNQGYATFSIEAGTHNIQVIQAGNIVYSSQLQITEDSVWQVDLNQPDQPPQNITPERQQTLPEIPAEIAQLGIVIILAVVMVAFIASQSDKDKPEREWRNKGKNIKRGEKWKQ